MTKRENKDFSRYIHILSILGILVCAAFCIYGIHKGIFTSQKAMMAFLAPYGVWGPLLFVLLQLVQVIIPIIPGAMGCAAGVLIFGPFIGFIYNYIGICIGSILAFLISRKYGMIIVKSMASQKVYDKYIGWLEKGKMYERLFAIAIFLPMAPDDFLCYLSGLTKMSLKKFTLIIILCKPLSIFLYSLGLAKVIQVGAGVIGNLIH
ncbi:TVP38/TMEM64 family protein [uncultured Sphaerochaeta sp.]|uniref:TVP38/TMEM64 family protein n=1 Tax=uncultured Sphaerochaeta sp. TaxID=886478 RepID=UPI002A0A8F4A|nr:TVP38/TMEM64 family protein [uncultured Sphaerochaeta sp.]